MVTYAIEFLADAAGIETNDAAGKIALIKENEENLLNEEWLNQYIALRRKEKELELLETKCADCQAEIDALKEQ